jgi:hypothetical protein
VWCCVGVMEAHALSLNNYHKVDTGDDDYHHLVLLEEV